MTDPWARPDATDTAGEPAAADHTGPADPSEHHGAHTNRDAEANGSGGSVTTGTNGASGAGHHGPEHNGHRNGHTADPELARTFGRPAGVTGAFANGSAGSTPTRSASPQTPAPALAAAFGRPENGTETLERPAPVTEPPSDETWWSREADRDPWRDPDAGAQIGKPALEASESTARTRTPGPRLSARELVFGQRVSPTALALLAAIALLVGAAGGAVGYAIAGGADTLTDPGASLATVAPGKERPPGSVADVAHRVVPAVVSMEVRSGTTGGTGSGVVIDTDGHIVTNNHVVELAANDPTATLEAVFASGFRAPAKIVGRDPNTDVAVVKVNVANPTVAQLGRSADLQVGDSVIAVGSPLGLAGTVTQGIVSSVRRPVRLDAQSADANPVIDAVQTDAAINPGNSGGALIDSTGAVVGINTAIRTVGGQGGGEGGSIGLGFAIPIDDVRDVAQALIRTGTYQHTDLGVNAKSTTDGTSDGVQILNVRQGGPGARAGLAEGDVVLRVDDRHIASADELTVAVREHRPGDRITLSVVRGGRPLSLQAAL